MRIGLNLLLQPRRNINGKNGKSINDKNRTKTSENGTQAITVSKNDNEKGRCGR